MPQGSVTNLHIARIKGTPSDPVQEATAISGLGLEGDRSAYQGNLRQVLLVDKAILDEAGLAPGQVKAANLLANANRREIDGRRNETTCAKSN